MLLKYYASHQLKNASMAMKNQERTPLGKTIIILSIPETVNVLLVFQQILTAFLINSIKTE
jgi:hypothetical protein